MLALLPTFVTAVAMIAYVGSETDHPTYKHGLATFLLIAIQSALKFSKNTLIEWHDMGKTEEFGRI